MRARQRARCLPRQTWRRCPSKCVQGPRTLRLFRWRTETSALRCRTRGAVRVPLSMVPNQVQQMVAARLEGGALRTQARGSLRLHPRHRRLPCRRYPAASQTQPRGPAPASTSQFGVRRQRRGRAAGCRARPLRDAEAVVRQLRVKPPGLKAGAAARDRHAAEIAKAERDVELARTAERAAAERWSRATDGSPIARAAMGQTTAE